MVHKYILYSIRLENNMKIRVFYHKHVLYALFSELKKRFERLLDSLDLYVFDIWDIY